MAVSPNPNHLGSGPIALCTSPNGLACYSTSKNCDDRGIGAYERTWNGPVGT